MEDLARRSAHVRTARAVRSAAADDFFVANSAALIPLISGLFAPAAGAANRIASRTVSGALTTAFFPMIGALAAYSPAVSIRNSGYPTPLRFYTPLRSYTPLRFARARPLASRGAKNFFRFIGITGVYMAGVSAAMLVRCIGDRRSPAFPNSFSQ